MNLISWPGFGPQSMIITALTIFMIYGLGLHWEALMALFAAVFSTGINRFLVRQQGIQVGGIQRFFDDQWRLEFQANYDIHRKGFAFSQVALAYLTPCVATRLRYSHVAITAPGALNKEDRIDLTFTLRGFGDWGPFGLR